MEIQTAQLNKDGVFGEVTIQILSTVCPKCHNTVQFVLSKEDRQARIDCDYYKKQAEYWKTKFETMQKSLINKAILT